MKILFQHRHMVSGGVEKALINLTNLLKNENDIDLFLFNDSGAMRDEIDRKKINVFEGCKLFKKIRQPKQISAVKNVTKKNSFKQILRKILIALGARRIYRPLAMLTQKKIKKQYDVAISYQALDYNSCAIVLKKVKAKKKIAFFHCDFSKFKLSTAHLRNVLKYDKIICVSKSCAEMCAKCYPQLKNKVDYLYNPINSGEIFLKSNEDLKLKKVENKINIVTAARLSEEKGILRALGVFKKLIESGTDNFCWHILGDGAERAAIEKCIEENKMQDYVILYGNQTNPYPFMKQADLFFLCSYHESFGIVLVESNIVGTPVLSTETVSSEEIIGNNGFICGNNELSMYDKLKNLLGNPIKIKDKKELLKNYRYDNKKIKDKFEKIIK